MSALDLAAIETAAPNHDPFDYVIVPGLISRDALPAVHEDFPTIDKPGSYPLSQLSYGPRFDALLDELRAPSFAERVGAKLGIDLSDRPTMITVRGQCRPSDGKIHTDSAGKLVTVLVYLNPSWEAPGGQLRLLRNEHDLEDYVAEVPPQEGTMIAFTCSDNAWHGHHSFEGQRRTIQLNWVRSRSYKMREQVRHAISASVKKLTG
ncbi:MAG: 2OG-Fe(II) oxygenase [Alphaproteobacteria bacterium]|nr:2OG-Fe(II) oxygenase [Alphaproteobacteria bacterium]